jgi:Short C-terminal domain
MPGLLRGIARTAVVAGTASAVGGRVRHRQDQKWARQDAQAAQPEPQYAEPEPQYAEPEQSSAPPAKDRLQQLKELGDLKAQGVLTEEEFATEKAKILAG